MERIDSVDLFRLIAIIAVIANHTSPFGIDIAGENETYKYLDLIINQLTRFAVPFFFIISGYFWGVKVRSGSDPVSTGLSLSKRIFIIFLAWCFIYLLPLNIGAFYDYGILGPIKVTYWNIASLLEDPVKLLMQGTKIHLWFLVGLLFAIFISMAFIKMGQIKCLIVISVALYLIGVLLKAYSNTPIGFNVEFNTRNGPFFSTLFFVTGYLFSGIKVKEEWFLWGFIVFLFGCFLHFIEIYTLWANFETSPRQDYVIGTYFMGVGVAMVSLSNHPKLRIKALSRIGQMTLGIYVTHFIFVDWFRPIDKISDNVFWELGYILLVLVLSILATFMLSRYKMTKNIVV